MLFFRVVTFLLTTALFLFLFHPFLFLDFSTFWKETLAQLQMSQSAFTFPYTLQYVNTPAYLYFLKDIFFYGAGPLLTIFGFAGALYGFVLVFRRNVFINHKSLFCILVFFCLYFLVTGRSAVKFMRYLLPLYPLLAVFAAIFLAKLSEKLNFKIFRISCPPSAIAEGDCRRVYSVFCTLSLLFALNFLTIYTQPHSRVTASEWILQNIPQGSILAEEHWDDKLPLLGGEKFNYEELALYEPDTESKWQKINQQLARSDYIILTSNRLYIPLQKMSDCKNLPAGRCYTKTANYYKRLFRGTLGFQKVAEFSVNPWFNWNFPDLSPFAPDESFTVYDHPKVIIFKKML